MSTALLERSVSYQERLKKQNIAKLKELAKDYGKQEKRIEGIRNQIADVCIQMINMGYKVGPIYTSMGGEKKLSFSEKTLYRWIGNRRKESKLDKAVEESKINDTIVRRVIDRTLKGTTQKEIKKIFREESKRFKEESKLSPEDRHVKSLLKTIRDIKFHICDSYILRELNQEDLSDIHECVHAIDKELKKHFGVAKSKGTRVQRKKVTTKRSGTRLKVV